MKPIITALTLGIIAFSHSSFAAKPVSIKFVKDGVTLENVPYGHYEVLCTNDVVKDLSAYNKKKSWCLGEGADQSEACKKKQIKAARKACKDA